MGKLNCSSDLILVSDLQQDAVVEIPSEFDYRLQYETGRAQLGDVRPPLPTWEQLELPKYYDTAKLKKRGDERVMNFFRLASDHVPLALFQCFGKLDTDDEELAAATQCER